jgi:hypothetical protein
MLIVMVALRSFAKPHMMKPHIAKPHIAKPHVNENRILKL